METSPSSSLGRHLFTNTRQTPANSKHVIIPTSALSHCLQKEQLWHFSLIRIVQPYLCNRAACFSILLRRKQYRQPRFLRPQPDQCGRLDKSCADGRGGSSLVNHVRDFFLLSSQDECADCISLRRFVVSLHYPSDRRDTSIRIATGAYIAFLLFSIMPLLADAINPSKNRDRRWFGALYSGLHSMYLSYIITGLNIAAFYYQAKEMRSRPLSDQALSRTGLAIQSIVFALVAISWITRTQFPYERIGGTTFWVLASWYQLVGWIVIDNAIFALGQAFLLWILRRPSNLRSNAMDRETEPLLRA